MKNNYGKWLVGIMLICWVGCARREICEFTHPHKGSLNILFDWQKLIPETVIPDSMQVYFYPFTADTIVERCCDREGINMTLLADSYHILAFNRNVEKLRFRNLEEYDRAEVYLPEDVNIPVSRSLNTMGQAEPFYTAVVDRFSVDPDGEYQQKFIMQPYVKSLRFNLKVDGLFQAVTCKGALTGLAASLNLSSGNVGTDSDPVTAVFSLNVSGDRVFGVLFILGINFGAMRTAEINLLTLDIVMKDGGRHTVSLDLTDALEHMIDGDIEVEIEVGGDEVGGLTAFVKAWETGGEVTVIVK